MRADNNRQLGAVAEQAIRSYLQEKGILILEMNYRCKQGEVDVIAKDQAYYVFIEVKYRNSVKYGTPQEAVGYSKQRRISKTALYYLYSHGLGDNTPVRFDVAAIVNNRLQYIKNAFDFQM